MSDFIKFKNGLFLNCIDIILRKVSTSVSM